MWWCMTYLVIFIFIMVWSFITKHRVPHHSICPAWHRSVSGIKTLNQWFESGTSSRSILPAVSSSSSLQFGSQCPQSRGSAEWFRCHGYQCNDQHRCCRRLHHGRWLRRHADQSVYADGCSTIRNLVSSRSFLVKRKSDRSSSDHVENFYSLKQTKAFRWSGNRTRHFLGQNYPFTPKNDAMCRQIHLSY